MPGSHQYKLVPLAGALLCSSHTQSLTLLTFRGLHCAACAGELLGAKGGGAKRYIGMALECAGFSRVAWVTVSISSGESKLAAVVSNQDTG